MGTLKRRVQIFCILICPLLVSACAGGPLAYLGAAYSAADGVSYAATNKSVVDNAISGATGKDCRLLNPVIKGKNVCPEDPEDARKMVEKMLADKDCFGWSFNEQNEPICINRYERYRMSIEGEESKAIP